MRSNNQNVDSFKGATAIYRTNDKSVESSHSRSVTIDGFGGERETLVAKHMIHNELKSSFRITAKILRKTKVAPKERSTW